MTDPVETLLRQAMADEADRAPRPGDLAGSARGLVSRRRRTMLESFGAVAVVLAVIAAGVLVAVNRPSSPVAQQPTPAVSSPPVQASPGTRLVGFGHAAIAVPTDWATNKTYCGTPTENTVITELGFARACLPPYPAGVQSVGLWQGTAPFDFVAEETIEIDGVNAQRQRTACRAGSGGGVQVCGAAVYFPSLKVGFRAESSTGPEEVDTILSWIRVVPDAVGIPSYLTVANNAQEKSGQRYVEKLQELGLMAEIRREKQPAMPAGFLLGVSPAAGTMVAPGSVVTVTVTAEPEGPADEVRIGVNSQTTKGEYRDLDDPAIRAGATIRPGVGDRIWAYADGKRSGTLAAELDGDSLALSDWKDDPNLGHSWVATGPGRTTVTLTITADGAPVVLGTVTVIVR